jgi:O-antigen/teichoic acid export membrane protein
VLNIILAIGTIQALTILAQLARSKLVALLVGPEGVGVISIVDQFVLIVAQVSAFSLPFAVVKFLSHADGDKPEIFAQTFFSFLKALILLTCAGSLATIGVVVFASGSVKSDFFNYQALLLVGLLTAPTFPLRGFFGNVLAAAQKPRLSALITLSAALIAVLAAYGGISLGGIAGFYWANLFAGVAIVTAMAMVTRRIIGLSRSPSRVGVLDELKRKPEIGRFCLTFTLMSFTEPAAFFIARYSVLVNHGEAAAGLLQASMAIGLVLTMALAPTNGLLLTPAVNRNIPVEEKFRRVNEFLRMLMLILAVTATPLVLLPEVILTLLFSSSFAAASPYLFGFVLSELIQVLGGVYRSLLIGLDDIVAHMAICLLGHLCFAGLSWLLTPNYGISGVAAAFIAGNTVIFVASAIRLTMVHRFRLSAGSAYFAAYLILGLGAMGVVARTFDDFDLNILGAKIAMGLLFVGTVLLFLNTEERSSVYRLLTGAHLKRA